MAAGLTGLRKGRGWGRGEGAKFLAHIRNYFIRKKRALN
jgi:hypothetical protein